MQKDYYTIQDSPPDFRAGVTGDGRQALIGVESSSELIGIFFDHAGNLIGSERRALPSEPVTVGLNPYEAEFVAKVEKTMTAWWGELAFRVGMIKVRKFDCDGYRVEDLPDYLQEFEDNPEQPIGPYGPPAEELRETLRNWKEKGMYVLWWGKDYWMTAEGEVDST